VFLVLTKDSVRWHTIDRSLGGNCSRVQQVGPMLVNVNLVLVSDVRFVERKGYLTMVIEGAGVGRYYFRRTEGVRQWGQVIKDCVSKKKEEFGCLDVSDLSPDTWLLDRLAPHTDRSGHCQSGHNKHEDDDSGFDSLQADLTKGLKYGTIKEKKCLIQEDEMQEDRLDRTGRRQFGRM
jgi:hypothetical protein